MGRAHGKAGPAAGVGENLQNPGFSWLLPHIVPWGWGEGRTKEKKTLIFYGKKILFEQLSELY